jgi:RNase P subunit RPR2
MKPDYNLILTCKRCDIKDTYPITKKQYDELFKQDKKISVKCIHCDKAIFVKYRNEELKEKRKEKELKAKEFKVFSVEDENGNQKKIRIKPSAITYL